MRAVKRILVAVRDPGARRLPAIDKAVQLARAFGAQLEIFHALAMPRYRAFNDLGERYLEQVERVEQVRMKSRLEALAEKLRGQRIPTTTHVGWDFPAGEAIVRRAKRIGADLIVAQCHVGKHDGGWFLRLTDWDLLRYSPLPVLLVKSRRPYRKPCLLSAVDPTHAFAKPAKLDAEILRTADQFRSALHGTLHVVHAFVPTPADAKPSELLDPEATQILESRARAHARARLEPLLKDVQIARSSKHLVGEHPVNAIPRLARRIGCDIVVMGAISRSGLKRIFIGNTAERMLDNLECDVLVVKPPGFAAGKARATASKSAAPRLPDSMP